MYWKRDIAAAIVTSLIALPLLMAGSFGTSNPPPPKGHPPKLGRSNQVATARTILDPAGKTKETTAPVAHPSQQPPETEKPESTEALTNPADSSARRPTATQARTEGGAVPEPQKPARNNGDDDQRIASGEHEPQETKQVEVSPGRSIQSMSPEQLHREVKNHRAWIHEGRYQLTLDHSNLSADELESITDFWYVTSERGHRFVVDQRGDIHQGDEVPDDLLVGDLDNKWPSLLAIAARRQLGPSYRATVQFALVDSAAVLLYRELSQAIGSEPPPPGTEFVLSIVNDGGQLKAEFKGKLAVGWTGGSQGRTKQ